MNNLITTIIGIALTAVLMLAGAYYGGQAYQNAQINAVANSIMNEAQQILYAERMWSTNNNQPDISGMGTAGASGTGMSMLVNQKELSEWPSLAGNSIAYAIGLTNPGPQPWISALSEYGTVATGSNDFGCYSISGYYGRILRAMFSYNGGNYVFYEIGINYPYSGTCQNLVGSFASSTTDVSQANHPMVKIAKAINAAMNQIAANANTGTMSYVGLPYYPTGSTSATETTIYDESGTQASHVMFDANGTLQTNYCYMEPPSGGTNTSINCVFGPS